MTKITLIRSDWGQVRLLMVGNHLFIILVLLSVTAVFTIVLCNSDTATANTAALNNPVKTYGYEIFPGKTITIDLRTENRAPGNPGNWTYQLETTPSNGTIPIKKGELIPNGIILYTAFPNFTKGHDYFTYKIVNQNSSGSITITSHIPRPIIANPDDRLIFSFVIAVAWIIAMTIAARWICRRRSQFSPIGSAA